MDRMLGRGRRGSINRNTPYINENMLKRTMLETNNRTGNKNLNCRKHNSSFVVSILAVENQPTEKKNI